MPARAIILAITMPVILKIFFNMGVMFILGVKCSLTVMYSLHETSKRPIVLKRAIQQYRLISSFSICCDLDAISRSSGMNHLKMPEGMIPDIVTRTAM